MCLHALWIFCWRVFGQWAGADPAAGRRCRRARAGPSRPDLTSVTRKRYAQSGGDFASAPAQDRFCAAMPFTRPGQPAARGRANTPSRLRETRDTDSPHSFRHHMRPVLDFGPSRRRLRGIDRPESRRQAGFPPPGRVQRRAQPGCPSARDGPRRPAAPRRWRYSRLGVPQGSRRIATPGSRHPGRRCARRVPRRCKGQRNRWSQRRCMDRSGWRRWAVRRSWTHRLSYLTNTWV
jgi:hypothetical protein